MPVQVQSVQPGSPAARARILPGETLVSINGNPIVDVLDYRFYETDRSLDLVLQDSAGTVRSLHVHKREYEPLGLEFETYLMDKQRSCRNHCIFCFIDQLPPGMRETLYFKDDDSRLSFLFGNYITLTNLTQHEVERIIHMHISPINVSVHTTNPKLRAKMMGNRFAGQALDALYRFAQAGIKLNCQLVLCPGVNDGPELVRSLRDLLNLAPAVQSIALVPLGVTKYRQGLYPLSPYTVQQAKRVVETAEQFGEESLQKNGARICYAADEFYIKAGLPIPEAEFYGDFDQLENGVGLLANLRQEFRLALEDFSGTDAKRTVTLATGTAAQPYLRELLDELRIKCNNLVCNVIPILNEFFGDTITVAGLVTGGDLLRQLRGRPLGEELLLPSVMLRHEGDVFLDDVSLEELSSQLQVRVTAVPNDGYELLSAVIGREANV